MKRKFVSVIFAIALIAGLCVVGIGSESKAEIAVIIDGSYLTYENESIGNDEKITRGMDLQTGYSKIVDAGPGKIYAGGATLAEKNVESVKISVMVERAKWEDKDWAFVDSWQKENKNAGSVNTSKLLYVEGDYYYRVRSIHSAGNDLSSSYTNGIYIEKPSIFG